MGFDPGTPGSCPEPKADAQPLSHPGTPRQSSKWNLSGHHKTGQIMTNLWNLKELQLCSVPLVANRVLAFTVMLGCWFSGLSWSWEAWDGNRTKQNVPTLTDLTKMYLFFLKKCSSDCYKASINFQSSEKVDSEIFPPSFLVFMKERIFRSPYSAIFTVVPTILHIISLLADMGTKKSIGKMGKSLLYLRKWFWNQTCYEYQASHLSVRWC